MGLACVKGHHPESESGDAALLPEQSPDESQAVVAAAESPSSTVTVHIHVEALSPDHIVLDNLPNQDKAARPDEDEQAEARRALNPAPEHEPESHQDHSAVAAEVKLASDAVQGTLETAPAVSEELSQSPESRQLEGISNSEQAEPAPAFVESVLGERLESTFEELGTKTRESDVEFSGPEGNTHTANDTPNNKVDVTPGVSDILQDLDVDLSESMKMRTLRSSSKKHKKAKNRRKRIRAQQFANGVSN